MQGRPLEVATRAIARTAGVRRPAISWTLVQQPTFDNQFATLEIEGRSAKMKIERTVPGHWKEPELDVTLEHPLA